MTDKRLKVTNFFYFVAIMSILMCIVAALMM